MEAVASTHEVLEDVCAVIPTGCSGIDLGIQIELGEEELSGTHACMAIGGSVLSRKITIGDDVLEFVLQPLEEVSPLDLGRSDSHDSVLVGKRNITEVVKCMIICNCTENPCLVHVSILEGRVEIQFLDFTDEFVCRGNLHEDT